MITEENWINFIQTFFGANASTEWIHHVASGWNHKKNESGCNCSFTWYAGAVECDIYTDVRDAKDKLTTSDIEIVDNTSIDPEGVAAYLERDEDVPTEPITTGTASSTDDYLDSLKDSETELIKQFEEDGPDHGYWESGDHK